MSSSDLGVQKTWIELLLITDLHLVNIPAADHMPISMFPTALLWIY